MASDQLGGRYTDLYDVRRGVQIKTRPFVECHREARNGEAKGSDDDKALRGGPLPAGKTTPESTKSFTVPER